MAEETLHLMTDRKQRMRWEPGTVFKILLPVTYFLELSSSITRCRENIPLMWETNHIQTIAL